MSNRLLLPSGVAAALDNAAGRLTVPRHDLALNGIGRLRYSGDVAQGSYRMAAYHGPGRQLGVLATLDDTDHGRLLHVSVSRRDRDPTWAELRAVKDAFFGDEVDAMLMLPRAVDYVNVHQFCMHLYQCPVGWGHQ